MTCIAVDKLAYGGAGLGQLDGKKIFVPFAAPGDVLEVETVKDKGSFAEARIIKILEPAACRVTPPCPVFGQCGGCQWQHLSYETQLAWKQLILAETLEHLGAIERPEVFPALPSPQQWNYRNRIQLHVDSKGRIGFYKPRSKEVVEFERCYIADERLNRMLAEHRDEYAKRDRGTALRLAGGPHFSQVNAAQNENVRNLLVQWLRDIAHETVIELYAGSGNFTFPLAGIASKVVALEVDGRAVKFARHYAEDEGIGNVTFHRLPAERVRQAHHKGSCDVIFLDPPRKGASEALDAVIDIEPAHIIYMSCDPATMARDAKVLIQHGWRHVKSLPIDMFPQTYHIESLTMLTREKR